MAEWSFSVPGRPVQEYFRLVIRNQMSVGLVYTVRTVRSYSSEFLFNTWNFLSPTPPPPDDDDIGSTSESLHFVRGSK